jgi:hypothetical protein
MSNSFAPAIYYHQGAAPVVCLKTFSSSYTPSKNHEFCMQVPALDRNQTVTSINTVPIFTSKYCHGPRNSLLNLFQKCCACALLIPWSQRQGYHVKPRPHGTYIHLQHNMFSPHSPLGKKFPPSTLNSPMLSTPLPRPGVLALALLLSQALLLTRQRGPASQFVLIVI